MTVREWFRAMRADDWERDVWQALAQDEGAEFEILEVEAERWTVFDTMRFIDTLAAILEHQEQIRDLYRQQRILSRLSATVH